MAHRHAVLPRGRALIELPDILLKAIDAAGAELGDAPVADAAALRTRVRPSIEQSSTFCSPTPTPTTASAMTMCH